MCCNLVLQSNQSNHSKIEFGKVIKDRSCKEKKEYEVTGNWSAGPHGGAEAYCHHPPRLVMILVAVIFESPLIINYCVYRHSQCKMNQQHWCFMIISPSQCRIRNHILCCIGPLWFPGRNALENATMMYAWLLKNMIINPCCSSLVSYALNFTDNFYFILRIWEDWCNTGKSASHIHSYLQFWTFNNRGRCHNLQLCLSNITRRTIPYNHGEVLARFLTLLFFGEWQYMVTLGRRSGCSLKGYILKFCYTPALTKILIRSLHDDVRWLIMVWFSVTEMIILFRRI